ncbi:unnamed protein product, partial [Scytosiphon promiscuus]
SPTVFWLFLWFFFQQNKRRKPFKVLMQAMFTLSIVQPLGNWLLLSFCRIVHFGKPYIRFCDRCWPQFKRRPGALCPKPFKDLGIWKPQIRTTPVYCTISCIDVSS